MEPFEILYVMFSQMILNLKDIYSVAVTPNLLGAPLPELHGHSTPKYSRAPGVQRPSSETGPLGLDPRKKLMKTKSFESKWWGWMVRKKIKLPGLRKKSLLHLMNQAGHFPFGPGFSWYLRTRKRAGQWLRRWFDTNQKRGQCCLYSRCICFFGRWLKYVRLMFFCELPFPFWSPIFSSWITETHLQKTDSHKKQTIEIFNFSLEIHVRENRSGVRTFTSPLLAAHLKPSKPITNGQVLGGAMYNRIFGWCNVQSIAQLMSHTGVVKRNQTDSYLTFW